MKSQPAKSENDGLPNGLSAPARRALVQAGFTHLEQLAGHSEDEIKPLHGIGAVALDQIRRALAEKGLSFMDKE